MLARCASNLDAMRDAFIAHIEVAKRHFANWPEGCVLAGPVSEQRKKR
jgi:hypothetical protein